MGKKHVVHSLANRPPLAVSLQHTLRIQKEREIRAIYDLMLVNATIASMLQQQKVPPVRVPEEPKFDILAEMKTSLHDFSFEHVFAGNTEKPYVNQWVASNSSPMIAQKAQEQSIDSVSDVVLGPEFN